MAGSQGGKKRNYLDSRGKKNRGNWNPKRGGPGILFTAETGRERKCQVEGLDILEHYLNPSSKASGTEVKANTEESNDDKKNSLSLEDELELLKSSSKTRKSKSHGGFAVYETSCRGTVFVLCTLPDCNLIPPISKVEVTKGKDEIVSANETSDVKETNGIEKDRSGDERSSKDEKPPQKKPRVESDPEAISSKNESETTKKNDEQDSTKAIIPWDPVGTVRSIVADLENDCRTMPSSRFVTRMIPIQATCFASIDEIKLTTQALIEKFFPAKAQTFAISAKRRNCGNVKRDQIIDVVAKLVQSSNPSCSVDLSNPDVTIVVEVCQTLCGICIVPDCGKFRNFNLVAIREQQGQKDLDETTVMEKTNSKNK